MCEIDVSKVYKGNIKCAMCKNGEQVLNKPFFQNPKIDLKCNQKAEPTLHN